MAVTCYNEEYYYLLLLLLLLLNYYHHQVRHQLVAALRLEPQLHLHAVQEDEGLGGGHPDHHVIPEKNNCQIFLNV